MLRKENPFKVFGCFETKLPWLWRLTKEQKKLAKPRRRTWHWWGLYKCLSLLFVMLPKRFYSSGRFNSLASRSITPTLSNPPSSCSSMPAAISSASRKLLQPWVVSTLRNLRDQNKPGVTGAVLWDSGVVLGKFLEHTVDSRLLRLEGRKCVELGAGCGLVGCIAALLGAQIILTDLPDRLRLLQKNVQQNTENLSAAALASVKELTWGDDLQREFVELSPDFVLASDVVYNEMAVHDLLSTLRALCSNDSTVFLAAELRNDSVLEYFLDLALKEFRVGRVPQTLWHPDFQSKRVVVYVMAKQHNKEH